MIEVDEKWLRKNEEWFLQTPRTKITIVRLFGQAHNELDDDTGADDSR